MDIGQAEFAALVFEGEFLVVNPKDRSIVEVISHYRGTAPPHRA